MNHIGKISKIRERLAVSQAERALQAEEQLMDNMIIVDPYEVHAPSRRSDKDLGKLLSLLDSLETGNDRKESTR